MPNSPHSDPISGERLRSFLLGRTEAGWTFILILSSCIAAWLGYHYLNVPVFRSARIATVALPAGILAAALFKAPRRYRGWCAVAAVLTLILPCSGDLALGWPRETDFWHLFVGLKFALDIVIFFALVSWWTKGAMDATKPRQLALLCGAAIASITTSGYAYVLAVDMILPRLTSVIPATHSWHVAHLQVIGFILGVVIPVPSLLVLHLRDLRPASSAAFRTAVVVGGVFMAVTLLIFSQPNPAWMFLSMAAVTVITFHYELTGAALAILATVGVVTAYDIARLGTHVPEEDRPQILILQLFLAVLSVTSLMMGSVLRQRRELQLELAAAKRIAEDAAAKKAAFLANMSHEIRSPLASLTLFSGMLKRAKTVQDQQEIIENLQEGGQAVLALLNSLLDFSRLEAGQLVLHPSPVDLTELVDRTLALQRPHAMAKGLTLDRKVDPGVPARVLADATRLRQVVLNLIDNAIKFTDQGGIVLQLGYQDGWVTIAVQDTGIGISAEQRAKLFLRFSQIDGAPNQASRGGAGLGLAISKGLVELMHGTISVQSAVGRGSIFLISFPASPADVP
jgi:signal transduction histidine kinase